MSPHETLFLDSTGVLEIKIVSNNSYFPFQLWDFAGDYEFGGTIIVNEKMYDEKAIFSGTAVVVYVIDAQVSTSASQTPAPITTSYFCAFLDFDRTCPAWMQLMA